MTSNTNTLVEVLAMEATSKLASMVEMAMYLATEPKPGQLSVIGRSLSTVLGMPMQVIGKSVLWLKQQSASDASFEQVREEAAKLLDVEEDTETTGANSPNN